MFLIFRPAVCGLGPPLSPRISSFRYGHALYGLQFHLEMTPDLFGEAVARAYRMLLQSGVDADLITRQGKECLPLLRETASTVFTRWSEMLC